MKKHVIKRNFRKLHKYIGFIFSLFILHLTITGVMLLYAQSLGVAEKFLNNSFLLKKYNMATLDDVKMADSEKHELIVINTSFYINNEFIDTLEKKIIALFYENDEKKLYFFHDFQIKIYLFEEEENTLQLIDIEEFSTNYEILKAGVYEGKVVIKTKEELYEILEGKIVNFHNDEQKINWFITKETSPIIAKRYLKLHQGEGISFHRIVTELHSGKFFGIGMVFLLLLSSLSIIFLVISSFVFGINYKKRKN